VVGVVMPSGRRPRRRLRTWASTLTWPTRMTAGLSMALAGAGTWLALLAPSAVLLPLDGRRALVAVSIVVGASFIGSELGQALIEVRSQAYSFSLSGVPLLVGLLYLPAHVLIPLRLATAVVVFLYQGSNGLKLAYNSAAFLLDTALVVVLAHHFLPSSPLLNLRTAGLCYLALAIVDLLMSSLVLLVIRINQGPLSLLEAVEVLLPASLFVALNTAIALVCVELVNDGHLGWVLVIIFATLTAVCYRAYLVLRRRHQSLRVVQEFIRQGETAGSVGQLCDDLAREIRTLVRATSLELLLYPEQQADGLAATTDPATRLVISADGTRKQGVTSARPSDWLAERVARQGVGLLINEKAKERPHRQWLAEQGIHDALVVPFDGLDSRGVLVALDRLGDTTRFTQDDLALLVTLAGHFGVALRGLELVERLQTDATHDALTGLPNRALLSQQMQRLLDESADGTLASAILLDLNRFKEVNDALGHHIGDQLLRVVGQRLNNLAVEGLMVSRLGGDEFALLLPPSATPERSAMGVAEAIHETLARPVTLSDVVITTDASLGIAVASPGESHTDLLRHADTAMYAAKGSGLPWEIYQPELDRGRTERMALLSDLRRAIERDELHLHYQPKLDLRSGLISSVEALVRWTHPTLGALTPDVFIPLAESTGLIEQLTAVVLDQALRQCRAWEMQGLNLAVAVNLSARNVNNPRLPEQVSAALARSGVSAAHLILEITESSIMGDPDRTVPTLNRLVDLGVTLSLDDFGTGYSSLAYLQRLPVREVKIDRSFVMGMGHPLEGRASTALVRSIISLGHSLGLRIVAEGVETQDAVDRLEALGCHVVQGYHVGRPVPGHDLVEFHKSRLGDSVREGVRNTRHPSLDAS
jgi:diguanylate cyclase (GGDEF)-like protein